MGISAHHIQLADPAESNAFVCRVARVIEDVYSVMLLLQPVSAEADAPLLYMKLSKAVWRSISQPDQITVSIPPQHILLRET